MFTGKGGVGKTTLAAATAALAASRGLRTLVMSADPAHSLADVLTVPADSGEPVAAGPGLWLQQIDARDRLARSWGEVQRYLFTVLDAAGVDPMEAEELVMLPGAEEVLALLEVRRQTESGDFDLVIVDCAPTGETLRLLALPDALDWYMRRIWPAERRIVAMARRPLQRATRVPLPTSPTFDALERLHRELGEVRSVLSGPDSSVRLVLTPERVVAAEARRTLTSLALYGYRVDQVIANRVLPGGEDPWRSGWRSAQQGVLDSVRSDMSPLPVIVSEYAHTEPMGVDALRDLAEAVYAGQDPLQPGPQEPLMRIRTDPPGYVLSLSLPLATRGAIDVATRGSDLIVTVGSHRRVMALPAGLQRCLVAGAGLHDGHLDIRFTPDPDLWPQEDSRARR